MKSLKVNKKLLPMKSFYFLWNAGTAPIVPYMTVYARQLNFTSKDVGIIYTIAPILTIIVKPITGGFADKYNCQKLVFLIAQMITVFSVIGIIYLPKIDLKSEPSQLNISCDNFHNSIAMCSPLSFESTNFSECQLSSCKVISKLAVSNDEKCHQINTSSLHYQTVSAKCSLQRNSLSCRLVCPSSANLRSSSESTLQNYQFWVLLSVYLIDFFGRAAAIIFGDAICFHLLGDAPHKYGYQRMYGALGWGVVSLFSGYMIDAFSDDPDVKNYASAFWMGAAILLLCTMVSYLIEFSQIEKPKYMMKEVKAIFGNLRAGIFLLWCIFLGTCVAIERNYLFFFLDDLAKEQGEDMMAKIKTIQGTAMAVRCLAGELPFFFVSGWILKRVRHVHVMNVILFATGVRLVLYSFLVNPWFIVPLELLNGFTFGIFYSTLASYTSILSTPTTKATAQGMVGALYEGAGSSLGALIGGFLYDDYGGARTFRIYGYVTLIYFALHFGAQFLIERRYKREDQATLGLTDAIKNVD